MITAFNLLTFSSAFVNQWLFGVVIDAYEKRSVVVSNS